MPPGTFIEPSLPPGTVPGGPATSARATRSGWWMVTTLFILLTGTAVWLFFHDDAPPDNADLLPQWSQPASNDNPLAAFCLVADAHPPFWGSQGDKSIQAFEQSSSAVLDQLQVLLASGNYAGKYIHACWTLSIPVYLTAIMENQALQYTLHLQLALRLYEKEHGGLPSRLEELPRQDPAPLPADPFSGSPMHWDREKRVVYSVGANLTDDQGDTGPLVESDGSEIPRRHPDVGFSLPHPAIP